MKFLHMSVLYMILAGLLCGCAGNSEVTEKDHLTERERAVLVSHVRRFLAKAKKLHLTPEERQMIQAVPPTIHIHYTGYKSGQLSIRWQLPNYRLLLLHRSGNLLSSERPDWTVRIISDQASGKIPKNFYGANGEDISLPPK